TRSMFLRGFQILISRYSVAERALCQSWPLPFMSIGKRDLHAVRCKVGAPVNGGGEGARLFRFAVRYHRGSRLFEAEDGVAGRLSVERIQILCRDLARRVILDALDELFRARHAANRFRRN